VLVTGAQQGIGRAVAIRLRGAGAGRRGDQLVDDRADAEAVDCAVRQRGPGAAA